VGEGNEPETRDMYYTTTRLCSTLLGMAIEFTESPLIEVMAEVIPPSTVRIFHVMAVRVKFLDRLDQKEGDR